jgi:hypothetical protein
MQQSDLEDEGERLYLFFIKVLDQLIHKEQAI